VSDFPSNDSKRQKPNSISGIEAGEKELTGLSEEIFKGRESG
jgi:hypothetical protein